MDSLQSLNPKVITNPHNPNPVELISGLVEGLNLSTYKWEYSLFTAIWLFKIWL